jgi:hypothetical protein
MKYVELVYQKDRRFKSGEKLISRREVDESVMRFARQVSEANPDDKWRLEYHPATKIVTNLMTGKLIEIDYDTPRACDPSSELYWSM